MGHRWVWFGLHQNARIRGSGTTSYPESGEQGRAFSLHPQHSPGPGSQDGLNKSCSPWPSSLHFLSVDVMQGLVGGCAGEGNKTLQALCITCMFPGSPCCQPSPGLLSHLALPLPPPFLLHPSPSARSLARSALSYSLDFLPSLRHLPCSSSSGCGYSKEAFVAKAPSGHACVLRRAHISLRGTCGVGVQRGERSPQVQLASSGLI